MRRCPITPCPQAARDDSARTCRSRRWACSPRTRATRLSKSTPHRRLRGNAGCARHNAGCAAQHPAAADAPRAPAGGTPKRRFETARTERRTHLAGPPRRVPAPAGQSGASSLWRNAKSDLAGNGAKMNQIVWRMSPSYQGFRSSRAPSLNAVFNSVASWTNCSRAASTVIS
jgi:hypothetical protein